MKITIGKYDDDTRTVSVVFEHDGVTHKRSVNACHTEAGAYDEAATRARVDQVALGVQHKISLGVLPEQASAKTATGGEPPKNKGTSKNE